METDIAPFRCGRLTPRNKLVIWKEKDRKLVLVNDQAKELLLRFLLDKQSTLISPDDHTGLMGEAAD